MKKTKNERISVLENEVAELKLIVHELRGKKSIKPSTTNTVEDIIEFEGQQYRKVDREALKGDYVSVSFENGKCFKPNKIYGPVFEDNGLRVKADPSSGGEYEITLVYNVFYGRTPETVDVYEVIKDGLKPKIPMVDETIEPLTPNQQRAEIIEKAKKFVKENVANGRTSGRYKDKGNSTYRNNFYDVDFFVKERKVTAVVYWLEFNEKRVSEPSNVGRAKCNPNDVFNEHIGKAISLGRALGLDVSEFEQAVRPTTVVEGMIVHSSGCVYHTVKDKDVRVVKILNDGGYLVDVENTCRDDKLTWVAKHQGHIINDTNAKYEG